MQVGNFARLLDDLKTELFKPRRKLLLYSVADRWIVINSALEAIEFTEYAIDYYSNFRVINGEKLSKEHYGELYLIIYGVIQTLFVQENAVIDIINSLINKQKLGKKVIEISNYSDLSPTWDIFRHEMHKKLEEPLKAYENSIKPIKEIRNNTIGHPSKRNSEKSNYIIGNSMSKDRFNLRTVSLIDNEDFTTETCVMDLVKDHNIATEEMLITLIKALREEEMGHYKKYQDVKLMDCFDNPQNWIGYIGEAIDNPSDSKINFALQSLTILEKQVLSFKQTSMERGAIDISDWQDSFDIINNIIVRITNYLNKRNDRLEQIDIKSYYDSLNKKLNDIINFAYETDAKYQSTV